MDEQPALLRRDPILRAIAARATAIRHPRDAMALALVQYWIRQVRR